MSETKKDGFMGNFCAYLLAFMLGSGINYLLITNSVTPEDKDVLFGKHNGSIMSTLSVNKDVVESLAARLKEQTSQEDCGSEWRTYTQAAARNNAFIEFLVASMHDSIDTEQFKELEALAGKADESTKSFFESVTVQKPVQVMTADGAEVKSCRLVPVADVGLKAAALVLKVEEMKQNKGSSAK